VRIISEDGPERGAVEPIRMNIRICILAASFTGFLLARVSAQIAISAGNYHQSFDTLAAGGTGHTWTDNLTLPGWYASKTGGGSTVASYNAGTGSANTGALYSFGVAGTSNLTDRALGSVASGTPGDLAYGVRFLNDTAVSQTNIAISYTGEQWRNGGSGSSNTLLFSYRLGDGAITNADAANTVAWTALPALDFVTPIVTPTASALDGNASANRYRFTSVQLTGVVLLPGQELFLRWRDVNDTGADHGLGVDDLTVVFNNASNPPVAPFILAQPVSRTATVGATVTFMVSASGNPAPSYQWQFNGVDLTGATTPMLTLNNVTTNQTGEYRVVISNAAGFTNSAPATLSVFPATYADSVSVLTYNVKGNGASDWSTNAAQVQAIARQLQYLQPDVVTFNEIPVDYAYEMTNWIAAFLPAYQLAVSPGNDGSICSAIISRHAITRSESWMARMDLRGFGYSNVNNNLDNFTRDLFEAEITVPGFAQPLHVFTAHLKATSSPAQYADNAAKRAAEAAAITNFLATNLMTVHPLHPFILTGDMNAPDTNELAIQKLISPDTGLLFTEPRNPITGSVNTYSTAPANPSSRLDYLFPSRLLFSNIRASEVFRTDLLSPTPPNLNSDDCKIASDHYPVLMVFNNPYDQPFRLLSLTRNDPAVTLQWESVPGQPYQVEVSSNLATWSVLADNLLATGTNFTLTTNLDAGASFFRVRSAP